MHTYTPDVAPLAEQWLDRDESGRLESVLDYHRREKIPVANERLHAAIHVVVETQVAMGEPVVIETMIRLQDDGLTRHEAIHAVGSVLADRIIAAIQTRAAKPEIADAYLADLKALTAAQWKA